MNIDEKVELLCKSLEDPEQRWNRRGLTENSYTFHYDGDFDNQ